MTTIHDPVEWLKAQVEMYLVEYEQATGHSVPPVELRILGGFVEYVEQKYAPKGLFDR